jgi:hypothetical protein
MDDESFIARWKRRPRPKEILATLSITRIADYFTVAPEGALLASAPVDWSKPECATVKVAWCTDCSALERRRLEAQMLPKAPYREWVDQTQRDRVVDLADYLARKLATQRPDEASAARILRGLVRHQRLG